MLFDVDYRLIVGAGIFVTTVVAGSIAVVRPFEAMQRPFLRDVIFYMAAVFFTFFVLYDKKITLAESLGTFRHIGLLWWVGICC